jgi:hypothetical protein
MPTTAVAPGELRGLPFSLDVLPIALAPVLATTARVPEGDSCFLWIARLRSAASGDSSLPVRASANRSNAKSVDSTDKRALVVRLREHGVSSKPPCVEETPGAFQLLFHDPERVLLRDRFERLSRPATRVVRWQIPVCR